jgi:DNA-binding response OmpR family regulator
MPNEKRVLVAEDDVATSQAWCELIGAWGFRVEAAEDGKRAVEMVESWEPHILLLDLRLPQKDGIQVLSELRERGLQMPTVMISVKARFRMRCKR